MFWFFQKTVDKSDIIKKIGVNYDGDSFVFVFNIFSNLIEVKIAEGKSCDLDSKLLYSINLKEKTKLNLKLNIKDMNVEMDLISEDNAWYFCLKLKM